MNLIKLVLLMLAIIVAFEFVKHYFIKRTGRLFLLLVILLLIVLIASSYLTSNNLLKTDNKFVATGASIVNMAKESIETTKINLTDLGDKSIFRDD